MAYTPDKPKLAESSDELRARIPGWGTDLDPKDRPSVPQEVFDPGLSGAHWEFPERQPELRPRERSIEHKFLTPVFGTSCPTRGTLRHDPPILVRQVQRRPRRALAAPAGSRPRRCPGKRPALPHPADRPPQRARARRLARPQSYGQRPPPTRSGHSRRPLDRRRRHRLRPATPPYSLTSPRNTPADRPWQAAAHASNAGLIRVSWAAGAGEPPARRVTAAS